MVKFTINVLAGDVKNVGKNSNLYIILIGDLWQSEEYNLENALKETQNNGEPNTFTVECTRDIPFVNRVEIWTNNGDSLWYLDLIEVTNAETNVKSMFPGKQWLTGDKHYFFQRMNTFLPQNEPIKDLRAYELKKNQGMYELEVKIPGIPAQVKKCPAKDKINTFTQFLIENALQAEGQVAMTEVMTNGHDWKNPDDVKTCYKEPFAVPSESSTYNDDVSFGRQRIANVNSIVINLCTGIPDKFGATDEMMKPLLEGKSIKEAIETKRLFIVDYKIFEGIPTKSPDFVIPAPIALFYFNDAQRLMPVAIQLFQQKSSDNPVFLPTDHEYTWFLAKLWFNLCDAQFHQANTHWNFTHQIMDGIIVVSNRQLASNHPIYKLLKPHFLYTMHLNAISLESLSLNTGGIYDQGTSAGLSGMIYLMNKGLQTWRLDVQGNLPENLKARGVFDESVLKDAYYLRDDGLLVYDAIRSYVDKYVRLYYGTEGSLENDSEIKAWGEEISRPREKGGCGILGVGKNGKFETLEQLVTALTAIIYTCSASHAAHNFQMYDNYGDPFSYPLTMYGVPPKDKSPVTEETIRQTVSNRGDLFPIMILTNPTRIKFTNSLGDFEEQLTDDPAAFPILEEFRKQLRGIEKVIDERNEKREVKYTYLHPRNIPNAISI